MRRVDALVHNAGLGWAGLVEDMTLEDVERLYHTNLIAFTDLTRLLLPQMLRRRDGDVVVVSSGAAWVATPPLTVYSSTKFGVDGFVEGLRREVWRRGVRVHSVNPGLVSTEWLSRSRGYEPRRQDPVAPLSRGVPAAWVASAVEHSLTRGYSGYLSVPRPVGLARLLRLQPLRGMADVGLGLAATRLGALGRAAAERRTP